MTTYDIATELVNFTNKSIFLTGKAGTGKTTFLRSIKKNSQKQIAIVAPTGVAAINAGGTTIHSFFQIAPGTLIPTKEANYKFLSGQQVNSVRRKIFAALELLVIDEISMVRADLLDLIDIILRHYRYRFNEPFGGVQVIFIGDMHQLPPVCNNEDWQILQSFYQSPFFFHAKVMQELSPVYVEFNKIFRQTNMQFVDLLNNVRNNTLTTHDFELLEKRYIPDFNPNDDEGYILLTTHNAKADVVNSSKLKAINENSIFFEALVNGDFPEKNFPAEHALELKIGAKVMFIANDKQPEKRYYNGKIGVVTEISDDKCIYVKCTNEDEAVSVERETWNNVRYTHDKTTNTIDEDVIGSFTQYPLRLAWAITIHKSQGLTFDKAVIDAGNAFSSGQVYVALSRCTTLDGIVLTTMINPHSLAVDENVLNYSLNRLDEAKLMEIAENSKYEYTFKILKDIFAFEDIYTCMNECLSYFLQYSEDLGVQAEQYLTALKTLISEIHNVGQRFVKQLTNLFAERANNIQVRVDAASEYFKEKISELLSLIEASPIITDSKTQAEDYIEKMKNIYELLYLRQWIIVGLRKDCSVSNYFAVKASYISPKIKLVAYAGATEKTQLKTDHPELYKLLAVERNEICKEIDVPVYIVATTKMLVAMTNYLPQTPEDLLRIKGFGKEKVKRFGKNFLEVVEQYCKERGIEAIQRFDFEDISSELQDDIKKIDKKSKTVTKMKREEESIPKKSTLDVSLELFLQNKNIIMVAEERNLTENTIWGHALKLVNAGSLDAKVIIPVEDVECIRERHNKLENKSLTTLHESFDEKYSFELLRVAVANVTE